MLNIICTACKAADSFLTKNCEESAPRDLKSANQTIAEQSRVIKLLSEKLEECGYNVTFDE